MTSSAFKILVLPFSSRLYRLAYSMLGNREEAEDVVQEVYLKLWKMREDLPKYSSIEALCIRITRNLCLDMLRRRQRSRELISGEEKDTGAYITGDSSQEMEERERREVVHKLINQLPEPQRSLVYFRHIEGREYQEIAELTEMNENAIRVSISRARKQLRDLLQTQYKIWTS